MVRCNHDEPHDGSQTLHSTHLSLHIPGGVHLLEQPSVQCKRVLRSQEVFRYYLPHLHSRDWSIEAQMLDGVVD